MDEHEKISLSDFAGETTFYDKKVALEERKPKSWLKSISAFANGDGGALFFGISDDDELIGISDVKNVSEKISECLKERMDPIPEINLHIYQQNGKAFASISSFLHSLAWAG